MLLDPRYRLGASVELLHRDPITGKQRVVFSSNPCPRCFRGLEGQVVQSEDGLIHATCVGRRIGGMP